MYKKKQEMTKDSLKTQELIRAADPRLHYFEKTDPDPARSKKFEAQNGAMKGNGR